MAELKTQKNDASVKDFLAAVVSDAKREDCQVLLKLFREVTGKRPVMWGSSIVGFGGYRYNNTQGGGEWPVTGFSPRARNISIYIMNGFSRYQDLMEKLGKHKTGKSCLYINKLTDVDTDVLRELIARSVADMSAVYHCE